MKYVIIHHHPEKLILRQQSRDLLFSTGNLLDLIESDLYSLQSELIYKYQVRPLTLILWGVEDRYNVIPSNVETLTATCWGDCYNFCQDKRFQEEYLTDEDGKFVGKQKTWTKMES